MLSLLLNNSKLCFAAAQHLQWGIICFTTAHIQWGIKAYGIVITVYSPQLLHPNTRTLSMTLPLSGHIFPQSSHSNTH